MTRKVCVAVVALILVFMNSNCAKRVVDWDVRLGECTDRRSGYYSYLQGLPAGPAEDVCVLVASRARIEGQKLFESGDVHLIHPTALVGAAKTYVVPDDIRFLSRSCDLPEVAPADTIEVGYFVNQIGVRTGSQYEKGPIPGGPKGLSWAHIHPNAAGELENALKGMLDRAAAEGADAIVDLSVYWSSAPDAFGDMGLYMRGRAVAYGTVREVSTDGGPWDLK
ncbi:MAG: hypothetical protein R3E97_19950 [Candidatus Eisenbacteria bacterium]